MSPQEYAIAWSAFAWLGWAIVSAAQIALWLVSGWVGARVFKRLRRVYHLHVMEYWLARLEREGKRTFQRPDEA